MIGYSVMLLLWLVAVFPENADWFLSSIRSRNYFQAFVWLIPSGIIGTLAVPILLLGIWMLLGRKLLRVNRALHSVSTVYLLNSTPIHTRIIRLIQPSSVTFEKGRGAWSAFVIYVNEKTQGSPRLIGVPRWFKADALQMAGQIADFLGVPFVSNIK